VRTLIRNKLGVGASRILGVGPETCIEWSLIRLESNQNLHPVTACLEARIKPPLLLWLCLVPLFPQGKMIRPQAQACLSFLKCSCFLRFRSSALVFSLKGSNAKDSTASHQCQGAEEEQEPTTLSTGSGWRRATMTRWMESHGRTSSTSTSSSPWVPSYPPCPHSHLVLLVLFHGWWLWCRSVRPCQRMLHHDGYDADCDTPCL
jgi:hypothetical protein